MPSASRLCWSTVDGDDVARQRLADGHRARQARAGGTQQQSHEEHSKAVVDLVADFGGRLELELGIVAVDVPHRFGDGGDVFTPPEANPRTSVVDADSLAILLVEGGRQERSGLEAGQALAQEVGARSPRPSR